MVPLLPTATRVEPDAVPLLRMALTPLGRTVHAVPSGEVAMRPLLPTPTNCEPVQNTPCMTLPEGDMTRVQVVASPEVDMHAPVSEEPTLTIKAGDAVIAPLQGMLPPLVQAAPSIDV